MFMPTTTQSTYTQYSFVLGFPVKQKIKLKDCKIARLKEQPYQTRKGSENKEGRVLKPACNCKRRCYEKISEVDRLIIFDDFWRNHCSLQEKRQYIAERITKTKKKRSNVPKTVKDQRGSNRADRRNYTLLYRLKVNEENIPVCQVMFLNTLSISESFTRYTIYNKKNLDGLVEPDKRGTHSNKKTSEAIVQSVKDHIFSYAKLHTARKNNNRKLNLKPDLSIPERYKLYKEKMEKEGKNEDQYAKLWLYKKIINSYTHEHSLK